MTAFMRMPHCSRWLLVPNYFSILYIKCPFQYTESLLSLVPHNIALHINIYYENVNARIERSLLTTVGRMDKILVVLLVLSLAHFWCFFFFMRRLKEWKSCSLLCYFFIDIIIVSLSIVLQPNIIHKFIHSFTEVKWHGARQLTSGE